MQTFAGTVLGKSVRAATRLRKSGGQALPGLVVEKLLPNYMAKMLAKLPLGVVVVTGTNGKTTTTKILSELLKSGGLRVLTNETGSNMTRGVASSLIKHAKFSSRLPYDIAVLEVDEASTRPLITSVKPRWVVALNVSRDQLDRFGEVDTIAALIGEAMHSASEGVIVNADDPALLEVAKDNVQSAKLSYFGTAPTLRKFFPSDYELASVKRSLSQKRSEVSRLVELTAFEDSNASFKIDGKIYGGKFKLTGQHNLLNLAAALALAHKLLPTKPIGDLVVKAEQIDLAFGRGEIYKLKSGEVELVLVKNPAGFRQALASYPVGKRQLMIAINDRIADGRDVSWLWDVDFSSLTVRMVDTTSGTRAADMALRLSYDQIKTKSVEPSLDKALKNLTAHPGQKLIFATYTAMTHLHKSLSEMRIKR